MSEDVFKVGSSSPSAVLLDAVDHLERNSAKADEDIRLIHSQLLEAVDGCIAAAGHEWDPYWQRQLLKVIRPESRPSRTSWLKGSQGSQFWKSFPRTI